MPDLVTKLANAQLFEGLGDAELGELLQIARIEIFEREATIFCDGDPGGELFVLLAGRVRISLRLSGAKLETLGYLRSGESFGEMAVFTTEPETERSATATADEQCSVLVIERTELRKLLEKNRNLGFVVLSNLVAKLSRALRTSNDRVMLLAESARL